jgi:hypothetical protein
MDARLLSLSALPMEVSSDGYPGQEPDPPGDFWTLLAQCLDGILPLAPAPEVRFADRPPSGKPSISEVASDLEPLGPEAGLLAGGLLQPSAEGQSGIPEAASEGIEASDSFTAGLSLAQKSAPERPASGSERGVLMAEQPERLSPEGEPEGTARIRGYAAEILSAKTDRIPVAGPEASSASSGVGGEDMPQLTGKAHLPVGYVSEHGDQVRLPGVEANRRFDLGVERDRPDWPRPVYHGALPHRSSPEFSVPLDPNVKIEVAAGGSPSSSPEFSVPFDPQDQGPLPPIDGAGEVRAVFSSPIPLQGRAVSVPAGRREVLGPAEGWLYAVRVEEFRIPQERGEPGARSEPIEVRLFVPNQPEKGTLLQHLPYFSAIPRTQEGRAASAGMGLGVQTEPPQKVGGFSSSPDVQALSSESVSDSGPGQSPAPDPVLRDGGPSPGAGGASPRRDGAQSEAPEADADLPRRSDPLGKDGEGMEVSSVGGSEESTPREFSQLAAPPQEKPHGERSAAALWAGRLEHVLRHVLSEAQRLALSPPLRFEVRLPEWQGGILVEMRDRSEKLELRLSTSDPALRDALRPVLGGLRQELEERLGLQVEVNLQEGGAFESGRDTYAEARSGSARSVARLPDFLGAMPGEVEDAQREGQFHRPRWWGYNSIEFVA